MNIQLTVLEIVHFYFKVLFLLEGTTLLKQRPDLLILDLFEWEDILILVLVIVGCQVLRLLTSFDVLYHF